MMILRFSYKFALLLVLSASAQIALAQQQKPKAEIRKRTPLEEGRLQRDHFRKTLGLDSARAEQVLKVQMEYKASMKELEADTSLGEQGRRNKIAALVAEKNRRLKIVLNSSQQRRLIPTTETPESPQTQKLQR